MWIKFLRLVFLNNLCLAFENNLLFDLSKSLTTKIFTYFKPYKHERISFLLGKPVYINSPYFSSIYLADKVKWWYKNLLTERI